MFKSLVHWSTLVGWALYATLLPGQQQGDSPADDGVHQVRFEAFVRGDLPAAQQVEAYTDELRQRVPHLDIAVHDVLKDRQQLRRLHELSQKFGKDKAVVPAFYSCNRMYFGFADAEKSGPAIEKLITADVYTRATCPRCQTAKAFIAQLQRRWPAIRFRIHEVTSDAAARAKWEEICRRGGQLPGLPTIDFAGYAIIGYRGDDITGVQLEQLIERVAGSSSPSPPKDQAKPPAEEASAKSSWIFAPLLSQLALVQAPARQDGSDELDLELELPQAAEGSDIGEGMLQPPPAPPASKSTAPSIRLPWFGTLRVRSMGLPAFTFAVGLVDGFNPCAMWVLVFLLSVLVNIQDRRKIVAIAGTFVLVSGLAYFAFMAAWLNLFVLIGLARPVQIALGGIAVFIGLVNVKDFFVFKKGLSLSIPESSKPGLYRRVREIVNAKYLTIAIAGAISLAVVVNLIELLCTAGLPALYTQILTLQELPVWQNYLYLALYIAAYMLDDTVLLVIVVATLSHRKLQQREGQRLKLISGLVILALGLTMIFRPSWLQLGQ